jgi:hypothetical protein
VKTHRLRGVGYDEIFADRKMSSIDHNSSLLHELENLEKELTLRNRERMEMLLHPDFVEFGRSGTQYTRGDVLGKFADIALPSIQYRTFDVAILSDGVALLTYISADPEGNRKTLRSSVWVRTELGWQIRFHQGTPTK